MAHNELSIGMASGKFSELMGHRADRGAGVAVDRPGVFDTKLYERVDDPFGQVKALPARMHVETDHAIFKSAAQAIESLITIPRIRYRKAGEAVWMQTREITDPPVAFIIIYSDEFIGWGNYSTIDGPFIHLNEQSIGY